MEKKGDEASFCKTYKHWGRIGSQSQRDGGRNQDSENVKAELLGKWSISREGNRLWRGAYLGNVMEYLAGS